MRGCPDRGISCGLDAVSCRNASDLEELRRAALKELFDCPPSHVCLILHLEYVGRL
jgi:hypothetical protein